MRLLLQFVNQIQKIAAIDIKNFEINLNEELFKYNNYPKYILHNYKELEDYKFDLEKLSDNYNFKTTLINNNKLPHYRYFNFVSNDFSFSIRIDGGITHGVRPKEYLKSEEMTFNNQVFEIQKTVYHDIIYNITLDN